MRLRKPLDSIFDKPAKVKILRVLVSPGLELTGREIAAEARISPASCARGLKALVETGLIEMRRRGRAHLYRLPQEGFLVSTGIVPLFRAERELYDAAIQFLKKRFASRVVSAVLFGSYARGEEGHHSDLDVLFLTRTRRDAALLEEDLQAISSSFSQRFGVVFVPYVKTVDAFRTMVKRKITIAQEILGGGKHLFGRSLQDGLEVGIYERHRVAG